MNVVTDHIPPVTAELVKVYGLRTPSTEFAFVAFTDIDEMFEWLRDDLDQLTASQGFTCDFEMKLMTEEELENLPEKEL